MRLINQFYNFLNCIFSKLTLKSNLPNSEGVSDSSILEQCEDIMSDDITDKTKIGKRSLLTRLYIIEQNVALLEKDFPKEYDRFSQRIDELREIYKSNLQKITNNHLTFEIDPDLDYSFLEKIIRLEKDVNQFNETEVKFNIISKRLQTLGLKLNMLYNVSIFHATEKEKVLFQIKHALETERRITDDFIECDYIISDSRLKEQIVNLLSYVDYMIFKIMLRNSSKSPDEVIENLVMMVEFEDFDYITSLKSFIQDEMAESKKLLALISDNSCRSILTQEMSKILTELTYSENIEYLLKDITFWNGVLDFETSLLGILKSSGVDKVKIGIIPRLNISINENDVLVSPKTNAYLTLTKLFSKTHDEKILLLLKLLKNISDNITYKELYFLILLFDVLESLQNTPNDLIGHIEKYIKKYPYDSKTIMKKKNSVISSSNSNKEYVVSFIINDYEKELIKIIEFLNLDFKIIDDKVLINSFYFNGLKNVLVSLQTNTKT